MNKKEDKNKVWINKEEQNKVEDRFIKWKGNNERDVFYFLEGHNDISTEGKNFYIDFKGVSTCHVGNLFLKKDRRQVNIGDYIIRTKNGFSIIDSGFLSDIYDNNFFIDCPTYNEVSIFNIVLTDYCINRYEEEMRD